MDDNLKESRKNNIFSNEIYGIKLPLYLSLIIPAIVCLYLDIIPINILTGLMITMGLGGLFLWIGNSIPKFSEFGGGTLLCIFLPALLIFVGILPESTSEIAKTFYSGFGFQDFIVAGLIVGSILSIKREILITVGLKMLFPLLTTILLGALVGGLLGQLFGLGFKYTILLIVAPIMASGLTTGAIPLSQIYADNMGGVPADFFDILAPAVMVSNIICILLASVLNYLGKRKKTPFKGFSGDGNPLRVKNESFKAEEGNKLIESLKNLGIGIMVAGGLYMAGVLLNELFPFFHTFVWLIVLAAILKLTNLLPNQINMGAEIWFNFISRVWVPAVLVAISASLIDVNRVIELVTNPTNMFVTVMVVVIIATIAGFAGWIIGFYFVESSIISGLALADMGGVGDVAVLKASERMGLFPFLQITTRIGGVLTIVVMSLLSAT
ncbi:2-hydroxycarboxylate transporter family protein [Alkalicoccobacillus porphyridii]|uniref:2-hydroxycarboxylate transporter family protein n=1 Tax=Alkalicoccobacillus porphyridii TaxID=2597270 RepID=A0A553ZWR2_9BACI|nr:2-hydroxycarboxylate transporter family protein [Alkalicoccobacillus porphyridii]TSB45894.1 2-hydroxycarboxylate transporter family protein [Alkalicoccobacillus porphyridii]